MNKKNRRLGPVTLDPALANAKLSEQPELASASEFLANTMVQRRNRILHGHDLNYGKAKLSVQSLLVLAILTEAVAALEQGNIS